MAYTPVVCELKCVGRDIKIKVQEDVDTAWKDIVYFIVISLIVILSYLWSPRFLMFLDIVLVCIIVILIAYLGRTYLKSVHRRCISHSKNKQTIITGDTNV